MVSEMSAFIGKPKAIIRKYSIFLYEERSNGQDRLRASFIIRSYYLSLGVITWPNASLQTNFQFCAIAHILIIMEPIMKNILVFHTKTL